MKKNYIDVLLLCNNGNNTESLNRYNKVYRNRAFTGTAASNKMSYTMVPSANGELIIRQGEGWAIVKL